METFLRCAYLCTMAEQHAIRPVGGVMFLENSVLNALGSSKKPILDVDSIFGFDDANYVGAQQGGSAFSTEHTAILCNFSQIFLGSEAH
jgi:hypothetical protein